MVYRGITLIHSGKVFSPAVKHPYLEGYFNNFNHAPNLLNLGDGNCFAAWFSGPWEGHPFQAILLSRLERGKWTKPSVFQNTQGLEALGNNLFSESSNTGEVLIANKNYASNETNPIKNKLVQNKIAYIKSGFLENSNVQMSEAMTELIIMQKAFSASAKTVTTSDQMIQTAINLKR